MQGGRRGAPAFGHPSTQGHPPSPQQDIPSSPLCGTGVQREHQAPRDAGVPPYWQGPLGDPRGKDNAEQSLLQEGVCSQGGTALHPRSLPAGHRAGLARGSSQGCWGSAYQALADLPCLPGLSHVRQLPPLQEQASTVEGFLGGLVSNRDATTTIEGTGPCVLPLGGAQNLFYPMPGRHSSWELVLSPCSVPRGREGQSPSLTGRPSGLQCFGPGGPRLLWSCSSVSGAAGPMAGAVWRELGGKGTHLPVHLGSSRRRAAVGREGVSAWP